MKKILSMLLVLVTMLTVCMSLVACGGPKPTLNLKKAEKNLEKNDYEVEFLDDEDYILDEYGDEGYAIEEVLYAEDDGDNYIVIYKFKTARDAKLYFEIEDYEKAWSKLQKHVLKKFGDDMEKEERKDLEKDIKESEEYVCGRSGKYVWFGTKDAVKDTRD